MITIFTKQGEKLYIPSKSIGRVWVKNEKDVAHLTIAQRSGRAFWEGYIVQKLDEDELVPALASDEVVLGLNEARKEY